jgi:hypothetical protein
MGPVVTVDYRFVKSRGTKHSFSPKDIDLDEKGPPLDGVAGVDRFSRFADPLVGSAPADRPQDAGSRATVRRIGFYFYCNRFIAEAMRGRHRVKSGAQTCSK